MSKNSYQYRVGQQRAASGKDTAGWFPSKERSQGYSDTKAAMNRAAAEEKARQKARKDR